MHSIPESLEVKEGWIRVISIDPGTTKMGVSVIDVNPLDSTVNKKLVYCNTIKGDKVNYFIPQAHDDSRTTEVESRNYGLGRALLKIALLYNPDVVICEDNFLGPNPDTFKKLIKHVLMLRDFIDSFGLAMAFVAPNDAKEVVKANFRGTTKEDVLRGVKNYPNFDTSVVDLDELDEHSSDSIAIGLYACENIVSDYGGTL